MAETLFRQWFVEEMKDGWAQGALGDEFEFTMGQSPPGSSFNDEGIGVSMFQGNADFGFRFPDERIYTTEPTRFAYPLDTLISVRAPVGAQNMANTKCCIGRGVAAFRYRRDSSYYTYTFFKLRSLMAEILQFDDEGTVFGSISKSDFQALATTIPDDGTTDRFEIEAKPINDKIIQNCRQIKILETLRDTLLPKLMSGEVRVAA
jgi:type I restriction enzyme S subunit